MEKVNLSPTTLNDITIVLGSFTGGGTERVAVNMIQYWVNEGLRVHVITKFGTEKDFYSIPFQVRRTVLGDKGDSPNRLVGLFRNFDRIRRLRRAVREEAASTVVSLLSRNNILTVLACMGLDKHVVVSERNDPGQQEQRWPWDKLRILVYKYADVITANSENALENMRAYVPESKLVYLPNPVHIPDDQARPDSSNLVLNVGRLVPQKGQDMLLNAFSIVGSADFSWRLVILGEGEEREHLEKKIDELNLQGRAELKGMVRDTNAWYNSAGIFVLSSHFEGTPNALLEAMAHGLPCIVSDTIAGITDLIQDNRTGLLFRGEDARDLAGKLRVLMNDPSLRIKLGKAARERMAEFAPERVAAIWAKVLRM